MLQPNKTLYVKNIDWKIKKPLLRRALYSLFSRHGKILEIVALRRDGLRGQAWIIMDSVQAATAALQAEQGFTFFNKDLVIEYARATTSDRIIAKRRRGIRESNVATARKAKRVKVAAADDDQKEASPESAVPVDTAMTEATTTTTTTTTTQEDADTAAPPPSKYLLAQNLPAECNEMMLGMLFRQYAGYQEVRMPRPGLAFVEFVDEPTATLAKTGLDGFQLTKTDQLHLTYGKA